MFKNPDSGLSELIEIVRYGSLRLCLSD